MARYEDLLDEMEEKNKYLSLKLKEAKEEAREWRMVANALAHAVAILKGKKSRTPWIEEYYKNWEDKSKEWWGV